VPIEQSNVLPEPPEEPVCRFAGALMDEMLDEHTWLTKAKLSEQLATMGF
jgi:hypothetical protein